MTTDLRTMCGAVAPRDKTYPKDTTCELPKQHGEFHVNTLHKLIWLKTPKQPDMRTAAQIRGERRSETA